MPIPARASAGWSAALLSCWVILLVLAPAALAADGPSPDPAPSGGATPASGPGPDPAPGAAPRRQSPEPPAVAVPSPVTSSAPTAAATTAPRRADRERRQARRRPESAGRAGPPRHSDSDMPRDGVAGRFPAPHPTPAAAATGIAGRVPAAATPAPAVPDPRRASTVREGSGGPDPGRIALAVVLLGLAAGGVALAAAAVRPPRRPEAA